LFLNKKEGVKIQIEWEGKEPCVENTAGRQGDELKSYNGDEWVLVKTTWNDHSADSA
jgi:hypothetical protein